MTNVASPCPIVTASSSANRIAGNVNAASTRRISTLQSAIKVAFLYDQSNEALKQLPPLLHQAVDSGKVAGIQTMLVRHGKVVSFDTYSNGSPLTGAPLDAKDWTERRTLALARPGVQELELDLEALAKARSDFADLRVVRAGNQIPYVLERPALSRSLALTPVASPSTSNLLPSTCTTEITRPLPTATRCASTSSTRISPANNSRRSVAAVAAPPG